MEETHTMENIIFNELKMRGYNVDVGVVPVNYTTKDGNNVRKQLEIDFVCNQASKRYYIQSAFAMPTQEKMEQEQRLLMLTGDAFKKIIITKDTPANIIMMTGFSLWVYMIFCSIKIVWNGKSF